MAVTKVCFSNILIHSAFSNKRTNMTMLSFKSGNKRMTEYQGNKRITLYSKYQGNKKVTLYGIYYNYNIREKKNNYKQVQSSKEPPEVEN